MGFFGGAAQGLKDLQEKRRQGQEDQINNLVKYAQLKEAGYDIQPTQKRGLFGSGGGMTLVQDPNFVSTKSLERTKLQNENELNQIKLGRLKGGQTFGGGAVGVPSNMKVKEYDEYGLPKSYEPADKLTPSQELAKDKSTKEIFETVENNKVQREGTLKAKESLKKIPTGLKGKIKVGLMKMFDAENPTLQDWQNVKSALTQAQLQYTQNTKGAVSDKEMALFAQAVANDDLASVARMTPQIDKLLKSLDASENAKFGAFKHNYGEDPRTWFGQGATENNNQDTGSSYNVGQIISLPNGKQYIVIGGNPNDPDLEEV